MYLSKNTKNKRVDLHIFAHLGVQIAFNLFVIMSGMLFPLTLSYRTGIDSQELECHAFCRA